MSKYPRYPYQSTNTSAHVAPVHQPPPASHQLRNPWVSELGPECRESQSTTNSSSSSRTYRGHHAPTPPWLCNHRTLQPGHHVEAVIEIPHAGVSNPLLHPQSAPTLVPAGSGGGGKPPPGAASDRERPVTPASSPAGSGVGGAVAGCGGHCVAFENFCYYCLQMVFVAGILTGVSLTIAGSVLRGQKRGGDLMVLVYIGCLVAMVCTLLLSVHCCVRRNVKRRKRALRRRGGGGVAVDHAGIPLQDLAQRPGPSHHHLQQQHHYQPLVSRLVQQQQQASSAQVVVVDNQRHHPQYHHHHQPNFRPSNIYHDPTGMLDMSHSGTPWWRREETLRPGVIESRH